MKRHLLIAAVLSLFVGLLAPPCLALDLSITAANVVPATGYRYTDGTAGETVTAGQTLYLKDSDSKYYLADSDSGTAAVRALAGIALNGASAGQPLRVFLGGNITIGATVTVGKIYVLSDTAGGIMPVDDLETGDYVTIVGIGTTAAIITATFTNSGAAVP